MDTGRVEKWVAILFAALMVGCAPSNPSVITSLEDLTTDSEKEGLTKIPQYRIVSVPGILPFAEVGGLHFYKTKRKPSSAIGLSNANSYILESIIESQCDLSCLTNIRDSLLTLRDTASELVDKRIQLTKIRLVWDEGREGSDGLSSAEEAYKEIRQRLNESYKEVLASIRDSGILIYRWSTNTKKSGSAGAGSVFGISGKRSEAYSGFALVSGLRMATLYVGNDFAESWSGLNKRTRYKNRFELTTHVLQARHILYVTEYDLESLVEARLEASYQQLANLPETVKKLDSIEIEAALAKVSNLSNMGILAESNRQIIPIDWNQPAHTTDIARLDGWQTFFTVKSDFMHLCDLINGGKCSTKSAKP